MEEGLIKEPTMGHWAAIIMIGDRIADETMLPALQHLPEKRELRP